MKNVLSKILLLALVLATVLSCVSMLASCSDKKDKNGDDIELDDSKADALSYLPDKKYNEDFVVVCRDNGAEYWRENAEGDRVDYAIYMRNRTIESKYGVDIIPKHMEYHEIPAWVADILKANDQKSMDIVNNHIVYTSKIPLAGNAVNLLDVPYMDFTSDWWLDSTLEDLTLNGKAYIAIGDMNTTAISATYCVYYNKDLVEQYKVPQEGVTMYDFAIKQGKWTYNAMMTAVENIRVDLNKDGRYNENDLYGLVTSGGSFANAYLWAWENPIFTRNENTDELEFSLMKNGTKVSKILTNICAIYSPKTQGVYTDVGGNRVGEGGLAGMFANNQALFFSSIFSDAIGALRDMDSEKWGIVPYPKYNEKQKEYITAVDGGHNAICIPKTTNETKLEKVGVITEALNCLSHVGDGNLVTEFYDKGLKSKYLGDPQEAEVINLIMDNRVFDFGYIYLEFKSPAFWIQNMIPSNSDIAGMYTSKRPELEGVIEEAYTAFGLTFPGLP